MITDNQDLKDSEAYGINYFEPNTQTNNSTKGKDKMTNIKDFKAGDKVRCIANAHADLIVRKVYDVLSVTNYGVYIRDESGEEWKYHVNRFEPVVEPSIEANDELDGTPCETRTVAKFEVGDKVYCNVSGCIETVETIISNELLSVDGRYMSISTCCYATQENYEMLCKLYPHSHFEKPPVILNGSDLCRAMLERGDKYVPCYVSNVGEKEAEEWQYEELVTSFKNDKFIANDYWKYAVPFDPRTGEVLTPVASDYL